MLAQVGEAKIATRYPGFTASEIKLDFQELVQQKDEVVRSYLHRKYQSLLGGKFSIETGHGRFLDANAIEVQGQRLVGETILIATGSRPVLPQIDGLEDVPYLTSDLLTSDEPMELKDLPGSLLVVGGGYIALELGQMFRRFGVEVTVIERSPEILIHGYEPEVGPAVRDVLSTEGMNIVLDAHVQRVRQEAKAVVATVLVDGRAQEFRADRLLVATGRRPNTDRIDVERAGVGIGSEGQVIVDEFLRTNVGHNYAAGDVIGRELDSQMATPVGSQDGGIAAQNALA